MNILCKESLNYIQKSHSLLTLYVQQDRDILKKRITALQELQSKPPEGALNGDDYTGMLSYDYIVEPFVCDFLFQ